MNYLVFLDAYTGELEKILCGFKSMLVKDIDTTEPIAHLVKPGDSLYFLRDRDEYSLRVKASVIRVFPFINGLDEDLPRTLKELQPRLQLTEDQYNHWSTKKEIMVVEFDGAQKINTIDVEPEKVANRSDWIAFEDFSLVMEKKD